MKSKVIVLVLMMVLPTLAWAQINDCLQVAQDIESADITSFERGLQGVLDHNCDALLPRVAALFLSGSAPAAFLPADTLALSGHKEYGPILIRAYFDASRSKSKFPDYPLSLTHAVLLACSDIPRGRRVLDARQYVKSAPPLDDACITEYRQLLAGHYDEYPIPYFALELLQQTNAENSLDIITKCFRSRNPQVPRDEAIIALQHMPLDASLPLFREGLKDRDINVRFQAVRLLSQRRDSRVIELFKERVPLETDPQLREKMKDRLAEEPLGEKP